MSAATLEMTVDNVATAADAQRRLDTLHQEQRDLPAALTAARRAGDVARYLALETRREDLPAEVDAAQAELLQLQIAARWSLVEECVTAEPPAQAAADNARDALEQHDTTRPDSPDADWDHGHAGLVVAYHQAVEKARLAREDTLVAFATVEALEDAVELLAGQRPAGGDGIRATPRPLAKTFVLPRPDQPLAVATLPANSVPPRWAAWQLRDNPRAFLDEPGDHYPRWDMVDPQPDRGVQFVSAPTLADLPGWGSTADLTADDVEALLPAPRIERPGPTVRYLGAQLPPHHVRPDQAPRNTQGYPDDAA